MFGFSWPCSLSQQPSAMLCAANHSASLLLLSQGWRKNLILSLRGFPAASGDMYVVLSAINCCHIAILVYRILYCAQQFQTSQAEISAD